MITTDPNRVAEFILPSGRFARVRVITVGDVWQANQASVLSGNSFVAELAALTVTFDDGSITAAEFTALPIGEAMKVAEHFNVVLTAAGAITKLGEK